MRHQTDYGEKLTIHRIENQTQTHKGNKQQPKKFCVHETNTKQPTNLQTAGRKKEDPFEGGGVQLSLCLWPYVPNIIFKPHKKASFWPSFIHNTVNYLK